MRVNGEVELCLFCVNASNNLVFSLNVRDGKGKGLRINNQVTLCTWGELAVEEGHT